MGAQFLEKPNRGREILLSVVLLVSDSDVIGGEKAGEINDHS